MKLLFVELKGIMVGRQFNDFDSKGIDEGSYLLRALANKLRIRIINFISTNEPVQVFKIHSELGLEQSITSQHLKILREAGIVVTTRIGKEIHYGINKQKINHTAKKIIEFDNLTISNRKNKI